MNDQKSPPSVHSKAVVFHSCYDTVLRKVDARYDIRGYVLAQMVKLCLQSRGTLPLAYRSFYAQYAQAEAIAFLEACVTHLLFGWSPFTTGVSLPERCIPKPGLARSPISSILMLTCKRRTQDGRGRPIPPYSFHDSKARCMGCGCQDQAQG